MVRIRILDEQMINMIAAGEVIERPASVVKELLENSIDAGATRITVRVEDGGRKLIAVTDDGCGMDAEDLAVAFKPHATSKISSSADLCGISTMGFRGEALASIAAVGQVRVVSRRREAIEAHCAEVDCGQDKGVKPCSADCGTTIEVRNLFYKVPARRKFLRTANTEMSHIIEQFGRIGLGNAGVEMVLVHNGREIYRLGGGQGLRDRIGALFGRGVAEDLIETQMDEKGVRIYALMGKPSTARSSGKYQYVFLNGRFIRDKFISHAIKEAYRGVIEANRYPVVFVFMEMATESYDVNVHPTKIEVRFENANLVHSQVLAVLREKLLGSDLEAHGKMPERGFGGAGERSMEDEARRERITQAMADFFKSSGPAGGSQGRLAFSGARRTGGFPGGAITTETEVQREAGQQEAGERRAPIREFLQIHNSYIVAQTDEGFVIIDQHALHERVIYEELARTVREGSLCSQRLLLPETFEVGEAEAEAIVENAELLEKLGIELEPFGPRTYAVQSFPVVLSKVNVAGFVSDLLEMLADKSVGLDAERVLHEVLDMAACKAAIKAGETLSEAEMSQLLKDKEVIERASHCPHGRPTTIRFSLAELERQFKRT
jgi:DNA mismatch repair protein MutL